MVSNAKSYDFKKLPKVGKNYLGCLEGAPKFLLAITFLLCCFSDIILQQT